MDTTGTEGVCRVCQRTFSKYTCPRCKIRYCSLQCYKTHGVGCTEQFYKEQTEGELKGRRADDEAKSKMLDILNRLRLAEETAGLEGVPGGTGPDSEEEEEEEESSQEGGSLEGIIGPDAMRRIIARLASGGAESDITEEDLTPSEWAAFQRAVASGRLGHLIDPYSPWWLEAEAAEISLTARGQRRVQEVSAARDARPAERRAADSDASQMEAGPVPEAWREPLPSLASLSRAPPSSLLRYSLLDLVYGYAFAVRRCNGAISGTEEEASTALSELLSVSAALLPGRPAASAPEAIQALLQAAIRALQGERRARRFALGVLRDAATLLACGMGGLLTALAHLDRSLALVSGRKDVALMRKKLLFLACWTNERDESDLASLELEVAAEVGRLDPDPEGNEGARGVGMIGGILMEGSDSENKRAGDAARGAALPALVQNVAQLGGAAVATAGR